MRPCGGSLSGKRSDDSELFREAMRDVKPIALRERAAFEKRKPPARATFTAADRAMVLVESLQGLDDGEHQGLRRRDRFPPRGRADRRLAETQARRIPHRSRLRSARIARRRSQAGVARISRRIAGAQPALRARDPRQGQGLGTERAGDQDRGEHDPAEDRARARVHVRTARRRRDGSDQRAAE